MYRYRLMAPGPTPVPESVLTKMALPILHHRTPAFEAVVEEVRKGLKWVFQTKSEVLILAASGTGAMEGAVTNLMRKSDVALCINGGKFGERWGKICKGHGLAYDEIKVEWGQPVKIEEVAEHLKNKKYRAIFATASETSTAAYHPIKELAALVKNDPETALVVDGITAVGVHDIPTDEWGIDVLVSGSQKAFMLPPGLAFASLSDKALKMAQESDLPKFYFNFLKEHEAIQKNTTAFTSPVSLISGLQEVLRLFKEEGLSNIFERHTRLAKAVREALKAMGLKLLAEEAPSNAVTAALTPEGINAGDVVKILKNDFNMTIAGGQDHLKGKIFRIGHIGYYDPMDMISALAAVESALVKLGVNLERGKSLGVALDILTK
ncbi:MAG: alanine--glyoxylate aminotransferase family protein [Deltaproteobacteria bacterium]|nr:alanine--glyoxylate aminotransferase family protein [Deltaproteobacteria bacterium]